MRLACFISPHGFGHAARTSAILRSCADRMPDIHFDLFTRVPSWLFEESIPGLFDYHETPCDVGFVQRTALELDLPATPEALNRFLPFDPKNLERLADTVRQAACVAVLCDISPLGIAVARMAGVPSILMENFTWDWLYEPYQKQYPGFRAHVDGLRAIFASADYHVQMKPVCKPSDRAGLVSPPVARGALHSRAEVRNELRVSETDRLVLITMGGVPQPLGFLPLLRGFPDVTCLITGASGDLREGNLILFDQRTRLYMPDLIRSADAVVAKLGYGTVAEVWTEGKPLAYVARDCRESGPLQQFVDSEMLSFEISESDFSSGHWLERVDDLLGLPSRSCRLVRGAETVAEFVLNLLGGRSSKLGA